MKIIFPYLGNFILPKKDIEKLKQIYNDNLNENFNINTCISENNNFNYFRDNSFFIYDQTTRASISELKSALGIGTNTSQQSKPATKVETKKIEKIESEKQLDDDDIMSNSFFTTLKML